MQFFRLHFNGDQRLAGETVVGTGQKLMVKSIEDPPTFEFCGIWRHCANPRGAGYRLGAEI